MSNRDNFIIIIQFEIALQLDIITMKIYEKYYNISINIIRQWTGNVK